MVCSLCGGKHNLRTCPFPGAKKHRALLQAVNKEPGKAKTPQAGRKPPRLGNETWGKRKKTALLDYSGPEKKKRDLKKARARETKGCPMPQTPEGQLKALDALVKAGFAEKLTRCSACGWSLGAHFVHGGKHVYRRCINMDCRRRHNMLLSGGWLEDVQRMSLSPMQLHNLLRSYTATHLGRPPSPLELARVIGATQKPVKTILRAVRDVEASAGGRLNRMSKVSGPLELDATSLRKIRIGPKTQKYAALVQEWARKHPNRRFCFFSKVFLQ